MDGFESPLALSHPSLDEDVEMAPFVNGSEEPPARHVLQDASGRLAPSSEVKHHTAAPYQLVTANASQYQVVLHRGHRHLPSREPSADPEQESTSLRGGWRPVTLQGYGEDPLKDEVVRDQTEIIMGLQAQVKDLQEGRFRAPDAEQRAREVTAALQRERAKVAQQEELIEQLLTKVKNLRPDTGLERKGKGKEKIRQRTGSSESLEEHGAQRSLSSSSYRMAGYSPMLLEEDRRGATSSSNNLNDIVPGQAQDTFSGNEEHLPRSASVPLPLSFKKAGCRGRQKRTPIPPLPPPVRSTNPPLWAEASTSASPASTPQTNAVTNLEAKVDLIINSLGIGTLSSSLPLQLRGRHLPTREFRSPRPKIQKEDGRNERLASIAWVRSQLHGLLGIKQDRDILNARDSLYLENTQLKHRMVQYEKDGRSPGPTALSPLQVNWDTIHCKWNECLLGLFLIHCQENGYGDGQLTDEDEDEIGEIFFKRLERIQAIINEYRPKTDETIEQVDKRYGDRHLIKLSVARRNRRRGELFNARCDINLDHLPDDLESVGQSDEETKRWLDRYKINEAFGIEGASSDETDPYDANTFHVHTLRWRNRALAKKMRTTDAARRATNEYGNSRPGNRPRTRKRHPGNGPKESIRKAPSGLPINCYDESWYNNLSAKKRRELCPKPPLQLSATWESD